MERRKVWKYGTPTLIFYPRIYQTIQNIRNNTLKICFALDLISYLELTFTPFLINYKMISFRLKINGISAYGWFRIKDTLEKYCTYNWQFKTRIYHIKIKALKHYASANSIQKNSKISVSKVLKNKGECM